MSTTTVSYHACVASNCYRNVNYFLLLTEEKLLLELVVLCDTRVASVLVSDNRAGKKVAWVRVKFMRMCISDPEEPFASI